MRTALWPEQTEADMAAWLGRRDAVTFVVDGPPGSLCGFAEASVRPFADGCATSPVAYLEGWFVDPEYRRGGVGAALLGAVETWARALGLRELSSDAELVNALSMQVHERLGFTECARVVLYSKRL